MEDTNLVKMRHSCAHLMASAVCEIFPNTKVAIGPTIENGFYYDFDFEKPITDKDLIKIEQKMNELKKTRLEFTQNWVSIKEANKIFTGQPYKLEIIDEIEKGIRSDFDQKGKVSIFKLGKFVDLCKGPHVLNTEEIGKYKLLSIAGAYWKGNEKNKMLTRIYATCFVTKEELDKYLWRLEEAKKRDHRKIGAELDLFTFSDIVGKGLPLLTPKGTTIRRQLEKFINEEEIKRGYQYVLTPPLARTELYKISGHYPYYKNTMYPPMTIEDEELILRPMTCPHHFMLYKAKPKSYRELPIRFAELSPQFRYEKSGELTGLMRVRMFCLADAHIFCTVDQAEEEIKGVIDLIDYVNKVLGLVKGKDYRYRLSLGDRNDKKKFYKDDALWDNAEKVLRQVLIELKAPFYEAKSEAAFYGPKIDIQIKKINGNEETAFTVQYDFVMPKRFSLTYIDNKGTEKEPVVIHRASIGAFERTMAFLIEHYAGALPIWLSPIQVTVLPVSDKFNEYACNITKTLTENDIRTKLINEKETVSKKIRQSTLQKIPYMVIIGDREIRKSDAKKSFVSVRTREGKDLGIIELSAFIAILKEQIEKFA